MTEINTIQIDLTCGETQMQKLLDAAGCAAIVIPDSHYGCYAEVYVREPLAQKVLSRLIKERNTREYDGSITIMNLE